MTAVPPSWHGADRYGRPDIVTASGQAVWFRWPERTPVVPRDLRVQLATIRRYQGVIDVPILAHLALCVRLAEALGAPEGARPYVAAHDLHEAYVGDLPTRLKPLVAGWAQLERSWEAWVHRCLRLDQAAGYGLSAWVRLIDRAALWAEMHHWRHPGRGPVDLDPETALLDPIDDWRRLAGDAADRVLRAKAEDWWTVVTRELPSLESLDAVLWP